MELLALLIVAGCVFGICYLLDKLFSKAFRNKQQHKSGLSVRFNKRFGSFGVIIAIVGIAAIFSGMSGGRLLIIGGGILLLIGAGLVTYYMTFGIFYDEEAFIYTSFGKKSITYPYGDIQYQQLYNSMGNIVIELHMKDGKAVLLQSSMDGVYLFLDKAFSVWLKQTGRSREACTFYDPQNSCWFPPVED